MKKFDILVNVAEFNIEVQDKDSKIHCQKCKRLLPLFRLILKSKTVKDGQTFRFKCRKCKHINKIKKEVIK